MGHQTSMRPGSVKPDAQETGSGTSPAANRALVEAFEMVEVWVRVSARVSGSITVVDLESSPVKLNPVAADFDVVKAFTGLTINAVGSFFLGAVSRQNSEGLGILAQVTWTMTGDITFAVILLGKE